MTGSAGIYTNLEEMAQMRQRLYRLFGCLFQYPDETELNNLTGTVSAAQEDTELISDFPFCSSLRSLVVRVIGMSDEDRSTIQERYIDLFQLAAAHPPCPLYESAYVDPGRKNTGWIVSQVERTYSAGGFALSPGTKGELPDQAGLELEFMSLLCAREADSRSASDLDQALRSMRLQRTFMQQHLIRWFPRMTQRVNMITEDEEIYSLAAKAAGAFVIHDNDLLETLVQSGILYYEDNETTLEV